MELGLADGVLVGFVEGIMLDGFAVGQKEGFVDGEAVVGFEVGENVGLAVGKPLELKQRPVAAVGCLHCGN